MQPKKILNTLLLALAGLVCIGGVAHAGTTGTEFQDASARFEGYATGYLAKAAAFGASGIGLVMSAWKQSLMPLGTGVGIAIFAVIVNALINATLTAVI